MLSNCMHIHVSLKQHVTEIVFQKKMIQAKPKVKFITYLPNKKIISKIQNKCTPIVM